MDIAQALFFSRDFVVPDFAPMPGHSAQVTLDDRRPRLLFLPSTKALRGNPQFPSLMEDLGLTRYWRESKSIPDHRRK